MLFLGAGASKPFGIPTMGEFTDEILSILEKKDPDHASLVRGIQADVSKFNLNPDIEAVLTVLRGRAEPNKALRDTGPLVTLFTKDYQKPAPDTKADMIVAEIEDAIYQRCRKIDHDLAVRMFGALWDNLTRVNWGNNPFSNISPQRIFTTNYDLSIETFLKRRNMEYDDGFHEDGVRDISFAGNWGGRGGAFLLYKMHGSINYYIKADGKIVRSDAPLETTNLYGERVIGPRMIYPAGEKYATRWPFYDYLSQLRSTLFSEPVCVVIGYSFRDIPVNNAFLDAVEKNRGLRVILVSPSASDIRDGLDEALRDHVLPIIGHFGREPDMVPQGIIKEVQHWRLPR